MAGSAAITLEPAPGARILIVEARFHATLNDLLIAGATRIVDAAGATATVMTVPGALELPTAIGLAHATGRWDAFIALGVVIRGETFHFDIVAIESSRGLMQLGIERQALIGNGILTVENEAQALERADPERLDKGGWAAAAALSLLALSRKLG